MYICPSVQNEYKIIFNRYERISLASFLYEIIQYVFIDNRVTELPMYVCMYIRVSIFSNTMRRYLREFEIAKCVSSQQVTNGGLVIFSHVRNGIFACLPRCDT